MKDRINGVIKVDWAKLEPLQPDDVKIKTNKEALKRSLTENGFILPFAVWEKDGVFYCIDGHTRKDVLIELANDGIEVPKKLSAYSIDASNKKDAIKVLIEVYNQKQSGFNKDVLEEWIDVEEIEVDTSAVNFSDVVLLRDDFGESFDLPSGEKGNLEQITFTLSSEQAEFVKDALVRAREDEEFNYIETFQNENSNGNAIYYIVSKFLSEYE